MSKVLASLASSLLNRLLKSEEWARNRLSPFAGQGARFEMGSHIAHLGISHAGLFEPDNSQPKAPTVSIHLPDDALARLLIDRASLFAATTVSGSVELAETLGFILRNVRWDPEDDVATLVGDVATRRAFQLLKLPASRTAPRRMLAGIAEYLAEEQTLIANRREVEGFCADVDHLRDDCARLEKRLQCVRLR